MARVSQNFFKLEMLILKLLTIEDCYGYQITQLLSELSHNKINIKEGTLYPILYKLIDNKYISDQKVLVGKRLCRVYYHIEPEGEEYLKKLYDEYMQTLDSIDYIMNWQGEKDK